MKRLLIIGMLLAVISGGLSAAAEETGIYSDMFQSPDSLSHWTIHEGNWTVEDGALTVRDGGVISLNTPPGGRFTMEFEIAFPSNWVSVILFFTGPRDYGTLYFGGGYWETFEMEGNDNDIGNYVQRRDPEIVRKGGFQKIKVVSEYGRVSFSYDGLEKGPATLSFRPGARVGFRSLPRSGVMKIRNFRLANLGSEGLNIVYQLPVSALKEGTVHRDYEYGEKPGDTERPAMDGGTGAVKLKYGFEPGDVFESSFVRIPADSPRGNRIILDVEGDGSRNNFFVILHDASGEQHLVINTPMAWQGWQEAGCNMKEFLESPANMQRFAIHWGGDNNQKIDFPIKAIDIGVAKHWLKVKDAGQIRFKNIRFTE